MTPRSMTCALTLVAALSACDSSAGPEGATRLSLSTSGGRGPTLAGTAAGAPSQAQDALVLTRVAVVLREIELEGLLADCGSPDDDDDCEEFEAGPLLLDVPLDGSARTVVEIDVPAGVYDELEFDIHKPEDDGSDPVERAFLQAHPDFKGVSIRVEGTWNGEPFVFLQDLNEEQEVELVPTLLVADGAGPLNLTLHLDVDTWFRRADGSLVDPRTANKGGRNEELVEENIRRSIDVFRDDDRDGDRDKD